MMKPPPSVAPGPAEAVTLKKKTIYPVHTPLRYRALLPQREIGLRNAQETVHFIVISKIICHTYFASSTELRYLFISLNAFQHESFMGILMREAARGHLSARTL